jgi:hypothetical protein
MPAFGAFTRLITALWVAQPIVFVRTVCLFSLQEGGLFSFLPYKLIKEIIAEFIYLVYIHFSFDYFRLQSFRPNKIDAEYKR